jgi:hypothetical protein
VDQAQVALLDQVVERQSAMQVMPGDAHHQAQVGLDHVLAGMEIAGMGGTRQLDFLGRRQQRRGADLVQINLGDVLDETRIMRIRDRLGIASRSGRNASRLIPDQRAGRNFCGSAGLP